RAAHAAREAAANANHGNGFAAPLLQCVQPGPHLLHGGQRLLQACLIINGFSHTLSLSVYLFDHKSRSSMAASSSSNRASSSSSDTLSSPAGSLSSPFTTVVVAISPPNSSRCK